MRCARCLLALPLTLLLAAAAPCPQFFPGGQEPTSETSGPILCNRVYAVQESLARREPIWSAEHLTRDGVARADDFHGRGDFHEDTRLPFRGRSTLGDYRHTGWTRGHMTPSGDAPDKASRSETFALSNIAPQSAALNSVAWEHLEKAVRDLAARDGEVFVVTGPAFREDEGVIGVHHIRVPSSIWKAVYDPARHAVAVIVCKNRQEAPSCNQVGMASLIRVTGVDPFPGVPEWDKETRLTVEY